MKVFVTHPGRQHVHQLLYGLEKQGIPFEFWTGLPSAPAHTGSMLYRLLCRASPQPTLDLPGEQVHHCYIASFIRHLVRRMGTPTFKAKWGHRADGWFDQWCARHLEAANADVAVCYENSALHTFERAKALGMTTILDAASFHHAWQDRVYDYVESDEAHAAINARKDEEIALADHILTVSDLARESYVEAGVLPEQVTSVPMGADLDAFQQRGETEPSDEAPFTFLFAGHASERKGVDVLFDASRQLQQDGQAHRVQFAGGAAPGLFDDAPPAVEPLGYLSHEELSAAFGRADGLVLPSRHDSFGRVVVEAMATGLPVLLSDHVGAKEAVAEGETGWVVPAGDAGALAERMAWCAEHPEAVAAMGPAAAEAAQAYSWAAYHERVVSTIQSTVSLNL